MTSDNKIRRYSIAAVCALLLSVAAPAMLAAQTPSAPAVQPTAPPVVQAPTAPPVAQSPAAPIPAAPETQPAVQSPVAAQPAPTVPPLVEIKLPQDMSPWGMFLAANIVVKLVMIGLAFASLLTWTIWLAKAIELLYARRRLSAGIVTLAASRTLAEALTKLGNEKNGVGKLVRAAETEVRLSSDALDPAGVKERVASRLERLEAEAGRNIIRGTGLLATIGATAPFVGLFGTVWGIMNSFIGIAKLHTTNLAVVAPGIAEALLATALGLVAAIPAVVMYNLFSRWTASYKASYADAAAEVMRTLSRDLDRGSLPQRGRRTAAAAE